MNRQMIRLSSQEIDAIVRDVMRQLGVPPEVGVAGEGVSCPCVVGRSATSGGESESGVLRAVVTPGVPERTEASGPVVPDAVRSAVSGRAIPVRSPQDRRKYRITSKLVTLESLPELTE
ncbi:MAG: hypothetical protein Q4C47_04690, partial [Planctomycetia bacterium]|nr:hypothetical protein [Planctomycetia bacterium]